MSYHARALTFLGAPVPAGNPHALAEAERRLGVRIPASVSEWYGAVDGCFVLGRYSNDDHALTPSEFRLERIDGKELVVFLVENQGVCWWGFDTNAGDDPPVYVDLDPPPDKLFVYSQSFSEFTFVRVFDFEGFWDSERCSMDTFEPVNEEDLGFLSRRFHQQPFSRGWPGTDTYRYSCELGRITIWQSNDQSDWILSGRSPGDLAQLRSQVAHLWRRHA